MMAYIGIVYIAMADMIMVYVVMSSDLQPRERLQSLLDYVESITNIAINN